MNRAIRTTLGALAVTGWMAAPIHSAPQTEGDRTDAAGQEQQGDQERTKLDLELETATTISFRVERRSTHPLGAGESGNPQRGDDEGREAGDATGTAGGTQKGAAGSMMESGHELRFDLKPQRGSQQGATLIQVEVSSAGAKPGGTGGSLREDEQVGAADRPDAKAAGQLASFQVLVDEQGRIVRMDQVKRGGQPDPVGGQDVRLDDATLRHDLALILGTGLHARPLQKGEIYTIGDGTAQPVEASAPKSGAGMSGADDFHLRFEGTRGSVSGAGAQTDPGSAKDATFSVLAPDAAARGGEAGEGASKGRQTPGDQAPGRETAAAGAQHQTIGRATYSTKDGLVTRFEARPRPDVSNRQGDPQTGGQQQPFGREAKAQWITIERISNR